MSSGRSTGQVDLYWLLYRPIEALVSTLACHRPPGTEGYHAVRQKILKGASAENLIGAKEAPTCPCQEKQ